ncbi:MAG: hypothetical protein AAFY73_13740, partial [Pseudomonadota bacterium]
TRTDAWLERRRQLIGEPPAGAGQMVRDHLLEGSRAAVGKVLTQLKAGDAAWFAVDECVDGHVHGPWFGKTDRQAGNMKTVARLASKTGAAIIPCWCLEQAGGYELTYSRPIFGEDVDLLMSETASVLRPVLEENYEQWFMLHELRPADFRLT